MDSIERLSNLELDDAPTIRRFIIEEFDSPRREHIVSVAQFAQEIGRVVFAESESFSTLTDELYRAALLHDIGYLESISRFLEELTDYSPTGWHPIDGANFLRSRGETRLGDLIEGHSNSEEVCRELNLPLPHPTIDLTAKIITFCDCQTGPDGARVSYSDRLEEIRLRHHEESTAYRCHRMAFERISSIILEINSLLSNNGYDVDMFKPL